MPITRPGTKVAGSFLFWLLLALLFTSIGLYGITSYQTMQRTPEIGLRMAFGANRHRVVDLVMRGAFVQVALGLALGIPIALIGARIIADQLYLVKSYDPLSLLVAVLAAAAAIAGFCACAPCGVHRPHASAS